MDVTLYIGNLPKDTTEEELEALFKQIGEVTTLRILRDPRNGESRGFGYLSMSAQSEADRAVSTLDDLAFNGHRLKVSLARPRVVSGAASPWQMP